MPLGPGKYDPLCTHVREQAGAAGAIVIVLNGVYGSGFSVQSTMDITAELSLMLREIADQIEASFGKG